MTIIKALLAFVLFSGSGCSPLGGVGYVAGVAASKAGEDSVRPPQAVDNPIVVSNVYEMNIEVMSLAVFGVGDEDYIQASLSITNHGENPKYILRAYISTIQGWKLNEITPYIRPSVAEKYVPIVNAYTMAKENALLRAVYMHRRPEVVLPGQTARGGFFFPFAYDIQTIALEITGSDKVLVELDIPDGYRRLSNKREFSDSLTEPVGEQ